MFGALAPKPGKPTMPAKKKAQGETFSIWLVEGGTHAQVSQGTVHSMGA
jgi:hypothetical protein